MEKLIEALTKEVRLHYGVDTSLPIPATLAVNMEARIKGYLAETLGICKAADVADKLGLRMANAAMRDAEKGLTGRWFEGENAKNLGA